MTTADPHARVLAHIAAERAIWNDLVAEVGEDRMEEPGPMGEWSFKDVASHLLGWRNHFIARVEAAAASQPEPPPPWPAELDGDDAINPWIREQHLDRPVRDVLDDVDQTYPRLASAMAALPTSLLTDPDAFPWMEGQAFVDAQLFSHLHHEHMPSIREWLATRD